MGVGLFCMRKLGRVFGLGGEQWLHPLQFVSVGWVLGYFLLESALTALGCLHLFYPATVVGLSIASIIFGAAAQLRTKPRNSLPLEFRKLARPDVAGLIAICGFVFFWNLYPSFDIDSLNNYYHAVRSLFEHGGFYYAPTNYIALSLPLSPNFLYASGFVLFPDSLLYPQLLHGVGKVFAVLFVYGTGLRWGLKPFEALIAPILMASEEHFLASGANSFVRVADQMLAGFSLLGVGFVEMFIGNYAGGFVTAILGASVAAAGKYLGVAFPPLVWGVATLQVALKWRAEEPAIGLRKFFKTKQPTFSTALKAGVLISFLASLIYLKNWALTGSPVYPAQLAFIEPRDYDRVTREVGRFFQYALPLGLALKSFSAFFVWPGVLSTKILPAMLAGVCSAELVVRKKLSRLTKISLSLFPLLLLFVLILEVFCVYEMRYHRYYLGVSSLAASLLIISSIDLIAEILSTFLRSNKFAHFSRTLLLAAVVPGLALFSYKYSFDVMGPTRPTAGQIVDFLKNRVTEKEIFKIYDPYREVVSRIRDSGANDSNMGYIAPMNWPVYLAKLPGHNFSFFLTAAMPALSFFDEGLIAREFLKHQLRYFFIYGKDVQSYPQKSGTFGRLLATCGVRKLPPTADIDFYFYELNSECLTRLAANADVQKANTRMQTMLENLRRHPAYNPFNVPLYSGRHVAE